MAHNCPVTSHTTYTELLRQPSSLPDNLINYYLPATGPPSRSLQAGTCFNPIPLKSDAPNFFCFPFFHLIGFNCSKTNLATDLQ